jgi:hypothetical protein
MGDKQKQFRYLRPHVSEHSPDDAAQRLSRMTIRRLEETEIPEASPAQPKFRGLVAVRHCILGRLAPRGSDLDSGQIGEIEDVPGPPGRSASSREPKTLSLNNEYQQI